MTTEIRFIRSRAPLALALLASVAATGLGSAASAAEPVARTATISLQGLNLAKPADVEKLDRNIARAADNVCQPADQRDVRAMSARTNCRQQAIANVQDRRNTLIAAAIEGRQQMASNLTVGGVR